MNNFDSGVTIPSQNCSVYGVPMTVNGVLMTVYGVLMTVYGVLMTVIVLMVCR